MELSTSNCIEAMAQLFADSFRGHFDPKPVLILINLFLVITLAPSAPGPGPRLPQRNPCPLLVDLSCCLAPWHSPCQVHHTTSAGLVQRAAARLLCRHPPAPTPQWHLWMRSITGFEGAGDAVQDHCCLWVAVHTEYSRCHCRIRVRIICEPYGTPVLHSAIVTVGVLSADVCWKPSMPQQSLSYVHSSD